MTAMFERLQKPFLTVETGEAYQPVRIAYQLLQPEKLVSAFEDMKCLAYKQQHGNGWDLYWSDELDDLHFESLDSYKKPANKPLRLGGFIIKNSTLYLNLPSFKRACLLVPKLHSLLDSSIISIQKADFINKVFGLGERLPHGFAEIYDDAELDKLVRERIHDYDIIVERCEHAATAEEAFKILADYTHAESRKRLPFAERYEFQEMEGNPEDIYLGFYIFLRSRELVAIRRWFGEAGFTLGDAMDETVEEVFGGMNIDIIE